MAIHFGTDGWRGVIAADFTFDNVAKVALATANYFKKHKKIRNGIIVGYDARFLSKEFAQKINALGCDYLDAPVINCTGKDVPMPYAANLEKLALVTSKEVIEAVKSVTYR